MMDRRGNDGPRGPGIRPFVGGRPSGRTEPTTFTWAPARPFSFTGARTTIAAGTATSTGTTAAAAGLSPTPRWTVAVYEPGLEHVSSAGEQVAEQHPGHSSGSGDMVDASLALAEDVVEAGRLASSISAAEVLEAVASRLRRGEILLLPGASTSTDAAVVSSVLAALLGGRR